MYDVIDIRPPCNNLGTPKSGKNPPRMPDEVSFFFIVQLLFKISNEKWMLIILAFRSWNSWKFYNSKTGNHNHSQITCIHVTYEPLTWSKLKHYLHFCYFFFLTEQKIRNVILSILKSWTKLLPSSHHPTYSDQNAGLICQTKPNHFSERDLR